MTITPGDEGGALKPTDVLHTGTIDVGDLDVWTFTCNQRRCHHRQRWVKLVGGSTLAAVVLWLYGPDGRLLNSDLAWRRPALLFRATNSGSFTLVAGDFSSGYAGSGGYRLTLASRPAIRS